MTKKRAIELFKQFPEVDYVTIRIRHKQPFSRWLEKSHYGGCTHGILTINGKHHVVWEFRRDK